MTVAATVFIINVLTWIFKSWVWPRFGKTGVQAIVFFFALIGAAYINYGNMFAGAETYVASVIALFSLAVALYEVLWSKFSFFQNSAFPEETPVVKPL